MIVKATKDIKKGETIRISTKVNDFQDNFIRFNHIEPHNPGS